MTESARISQSASAVLEPDDVTSPEPKKAPRRRTQPSPVMHTWFHRVRGTTSVTVGATGHTHGDMKDGRLVVLCPVCEPHLAAANFSTRPNDVELTFDELQEKERMSEEERFLATQMARALADSGRQLLAERKAVSA